MSSARDYLDAGIDALGLLGNPADPTIAFDRFSHAVSMDPGMCDAWLGLIATGDHSSQTLRHAHETSATLHRETRRLGLQDTALDASVASPGFIEVFPYTPASITLAYVAALLTESDYDTAEKLLESYDTATEPQQSPIWRCLGVTLHYVTQRWTDVARLVRTPGRGHLAGGRCRHRSDGRYRPYRSGRVRRRPEPARRHTFQPGQPSRRRLRRSLPWICVALPGPRRRCTCRAG